MDAMDDPLEPQTPASRWHALWHFGPAVIYVAAVFYGGSIGMGTLPGSEILTADKLLHALAFGGMQLLLLRAVRFEWPAISFARQNLYALIGASALGGLLELHQAALPHRSAELLDWVADTLGALGVALLAGLVRRRSRAARSEACPSERDGRA